MSLQNRFLRETLLTRAFTGFDGFDRWLRVRLILSGAELQSDLVRVGTHHAKTASAGFERRSPHKKD
jgi:hypothetical protein